ncbi:MAG: ABC transporter permease [Myxococcaceae bacterium]
MSGAVSTWALDWATVRVLAWRDVIRFFRQPSRIVGALAQPMLFWWVIGSGFSGSFASRAAGGLSYGAFFFPGVLAMVVLFSAIFATISVVEDRRGGFLAAVLAGPASRGAVALGKCLGSTAVALMQASLFLLLAPLAGLSFSAMALGPLALGALLLALALTGVGVTLAWWVKSTAGYHGVMSVVLIPLWLLSGGLFPVEGAGPIVAALMRFNPLRVGVDVLRAALSDASVTTDGQALSLGLLMLAVFAAAGLGAAMLSVSRRD